MSEVEETLNRIKTHKSIQGIVIVNSDGHIIRSTYQPQGVEKQEEGQKIASYLFNITNKARSLVRDLDPLNDLTFLKIKCKPVEGKAFDPKSTDQKNATEIMVAPGQYYFYPFNYIQKDKDFMLIVIQGPKGDKKEEE